MSNCYSELGYGVIIVVVIKENEFRSLVRGVSPLWWKMFSSEKYIRLAKIESIFGHTKHTSLSFFLSAEREVHCAVFNIPAALMVQKVVPYYMTLGRSLCWVNLTNIFWWWSSSILTISNLPRKSIPPLPSPTSTICSISSFAMIRAYSCLVPSFC